MDNDRHEGETSAESVRAGRDAFVAGRDAKSGAELAPAREVRGQLYSSRPAKLDIKVVNNSPDTVIVHHVQLEVALSVNRVPVVPFVHAASADLRPSLSIHGPIGFEPQAPEQGGAGVTLTFHLEDPAAPVALTSRYQWTGYTEYGSGRLENGHPSSSR